MIRSLVYLPLSIGYYTLLVTEMLFYPPNYNDAWLHDFHRPTHTTLLFFAFLVLIVSVAKSDIFLPLWFCGTIIGVADRANTRTCHSCQLYFFVKEGESKVLSFRYSIVYSLGEPFQVKILVGMMSGKSTDRPRNTEDRGEYLRTIT